MQTSLPTKGARVERLRPIPSETQVFLKANQIAQDASGKKIPNNPNKEQIGKTC